MSIGAFSGADRTHDLFISYARDDMADVLPLVQALRANGLQVWFDQSEIRIGDDWRRKMDEGMRKSRFALVVFSPAFFGKYWTQYELDSLITARTLGEGAILPIYHNISNQDIAENAPSLRTTASLQLSDPLDQLVREIVAKVRDEPVRQIPTQPERGPTTSEERGFGVFYVADAGTSEPTGPVPKRDMFSFQPQQTGWVSVVRGDSELEYIREDGLLRIRLDWGNSLSGDEITASSLMSGDREFALVVRLASGKQHYYPSLVNTSPRSWVMGRGNPSGWMVFKASP